MEGIFIPNPVNAPQGDTFNEAEKEEEESKLVTTVEEIASAMLRLALEFGEKGFLQREFILYLRRLMKDITGVEPPMGAGAMPQPEMENVCPHPENHQPPGGFPSPGAGGSPIYGRSQPRSRRNNFSPSPEVSEGSSAGDYRGGGGMLGRSPRMPSPRRMRAIRKAPATVAKMERQMAVPSNPMNVTFNIPPWAATVRKYTFDNLSPMSPGSQSYSGDTDSGEWAPQPGAFIPCRLTPMNDSNESNYCEHLRPSPKQSLFGQVSVGSPINDSCYCQPLPQTPMARQRSATGRKSSVRRPRTGSPPRNCSCSPPRR